MSVTTENKVTKVAAKFGPHFTDFALAIGVPYTTAIGWRDNDSIPHLSHAHILGKAKNLGIPLVKKELIDRKFVDAASA